MSDIVVFQSTLSVRRATFKLNYLLPYLIISIHALREESDSKNAQIISDESVNIYKKLK